MSETVAPILQYNAGGWNRLTPKIAFEADVVLSVNGEAWLNFACTPSNLDALAVGFLFNEGIIQSSSEVVNIKPCKDNTHIDVWLNHAVQKPLQWRRTSGCTGGATQARNAPVPTVIYREDFQLSPGHILDNMDQLFKGQALYHISRGIHCAALSDGVSIQLLTEDIGRHNTLDKLAGLVLLSSPALARRVLLTTGRVSSEMLQKAARIQAQVVISRTSPTELSVRLAQQAGITLIGYARRGTFNIYTHPQRVQGAPNTASDLELETENRTFNC